MSDVGVSEVRCPACEGDVEIDSSTRQFEIVECPDCRSELEVIGLSPMMLALAPEVDEDWGE
ncbi:lysine biosynthesis protein LysW [Nonomuraea fuscirosea]|uniref:lysine biosynthesis protein LysW n=1 Tax=Nonomuraea fuscirosea TaxID=1291556 RepID=UPI0033F9AB87